jgi:hypothetical protein
VVGKDLEEKMVEQWESRAFIDAERGGLAVHAPCTQRLALRQPLPASHMTLAINYLRIRPVFQP